jgi:hypothetical protein
MHTALCAHRSVPTSPPDAVSFAPPPGRQGQGRSPQPRSAPYLPVVVRRRTFAQGFIGATQQAYEQWVRTAFGDRASAVLARYPWPADADRFTAAYLIGAIMTDSGYIVGIGGCANRRLTQDFARWTRTWAYEFAHGTGPGLTPIPGYVWGAGARRGACLPVPHLRQRRSDRPHLRRGGTAAGQRDEALLGRLHPVRHPECPRARRVAAVRPTGEVMSLRAGGQSRPISDAQFVAEHQCAFWDAMA